MKLSAPLCSEVDPRWKETKKMQFTMGNLSSIASARHMNSGSDHNCSLALERAICWDGPHCSLVWDLMLRFFWGNHSQDWLVYVFFIRWAIFKKGWNRKLHVSRYFLLVYVVFWVADGWAGKRSGWCYETILILTKIEREIEETTQKRLNMKRIGYCIRDTAAMIKWGLDGWKPWQHNNKN